MASCTMSWGFIVSLRLLDMLFMGAQRPRERKQTRMVKSRALMFSPPSYIVTSDINCLQDLWVGWSCLNSGMN